MADPKVEALRKVPLFADFSARDLQFVASECDEADVETGRTLISQGKPTDTFYVLLSGDADVFVDGKIRRTLRAGDFFGEIGMLDRGPATATVTTKTPARLMVMSHSQFRDAIKGNEDLLTQVLRAMAERLRADSMGRLGKV